jgi:hypothetical protein
MGLFFGLHSFSVSVLSDVSEIVSVTFFVSALDVKVAKPSYCVFLDMSFSTGRK